MMTMPQTIFVCFISIAGCNYLGSHGVPVYKVFGLQPTCVICEESVF